MSSIDVPTLATPRLTLEPLARDHRPGMFDLWSHPDVVRYSGRIRDSLGNPITAPVASVSDSDRILEFWLQARWEGWGFRWEGWGFRWAVCRGGSHDCLGTVGFNSIGTCSEIAYHLHPDHWGKGYMTEAAQAALDWLGGGENRHLVEAFIEPPNAQSIALARRLGFHATDSMSEGAQRYLKTL